MSANAGSREPAEAPRCRRIVRFLYVTNAVGDGEAKDGNGFIARVGLDGPDPGADWARGLDAPKGVYAARRSRSTSPISTRWS